MAKIEVVTYRDEWKQQFEWIANQIKNALPISILSIEHVGSTAVPGLKAKPIIDIDIVIPDDEKIGKQCLFALRKLGYEHIGDMGITGREAFAIPNHSAIHSWPKHHLYLCTENSLGLQNHIAFRNYLRTHPEDRVKYSALKEQLAAQFPSDIDAYVEGKSDFIGHILRNAGIDSQLVDQIKNENKAD